MLYRKNGLEAKEKIASLAGLWCRRWACPFGLAWGGMGPPPVWTGLGLGSPPWVKPEAGP
ncbi:MAG: hypothetical protein A2600_01345 [Candidatus Lambdaproteobacteria bacterium RIFOXYD1_FULL_56_27]|uniref:Uncharacterized protein n=1 Tax=Candidatus Lambdaproteobacteria bacterium RIFOXYD2_FULL_56_26 TaxID=1817773 RepID=A0A1F6GSB6_9PROT|nr:MAG: hypothetical protein A2557_00460 [Candidatus Lambdaproteobacteria bacterium RIFOXYD2_FULL_56_26]OGH01379.1 MAG: hypothetical protein A2426_13295 [Candidatus Lambdaproteobacteria bacterium RIFOXYC1_FULL_56_13]OGH06920.1 MAG: hypothetical protein A2600_01345 [Candidatus Lambdaproteobacteria bacterium RIFOXYD1_FULL_56_27]